MPGSTVTTSPGASGFVPDAPDVRQLVDLETDAVSGAVDEAARRAAVLRTLLPGAERVVSGFPDDVLDQLVHLAARDAGSQGLDPGVLRALRDLVHLRDLGRRLALGDRAGHIGVVPRRLVLREDVHDDRLARAQRTGPDHVRIRGLLPRRDDRSFRDAAQLRAAVTRRSRGDVRR